MAKIKRVEDLEAWKIARMVTKEVHQFFINCERFKRRGSRTTFCDIRPKLHF